MPDTRPGITFENNICSACINFEKQKSVDWDKRLKELENLCSKYRGSNGDGYDCAIAISGGKDSHFQVYIIKEIMKMNPVLLTIGNVDWTKTGIDNLRNISDAFGCDVIQFNPNLRVTRILVKKAFEEIGQPTWYIDQLIYAQPLKMTMNLGLKLIFYGEDVNFTYGGKFNQETPSALSQPENGVNLPHWDKWLQDPNISEKDLDSARHSPIEKYKEFGLEPTYLSYFVQWNSVHHYEVAKKWGFKHLGHEYQREGSIDNYDQIDSISYLINPYLKYPKFGHSIATDNASRWIRYGLKTREEMIPIVEKHDGMLDQGIVEKFCEFIRISIPDFYKTLDKWYNPDLFEKTRDGIWKPKFQVGVGMKN